MPTPTVICVTPTKNEAWILDRFLAMASQWADRILVLDQCSDDASRVIARAHPKVTLLTSDDAAYDEGARQRRLLDAAREVPGPRVIIALDADEAMSANVMTSRSWREALRQPPGTVLELRWANLLPGYSRAWVPPHRIAFGFVDDGRPHRGPRIHSTRVPTDRDRPAYSIDDVNVLHYQYAVWTRLQSKQRWYQCWETLNAPSKRPIQIYRQYHAMDAIPDDEIKDVHDSWFAAYEKLGIDPRVKSSDDIYYWDEEIVSLLLEYGPQRFRRIALWEFDWVNTALRCGRSPADAARLSDPRTAVERRMHAWLRATQHRAGARWVRSVQRALVPLGW